jgi:hypothetical protein
MQYLFRSQGAPSMATHAIRQNREQGSFHARVGIDRNAILLLLPIADMLGGTGFYD